MRPPAYVVVFVALVLLTGLTIWLSNVDLGRLHTTVGLAIAGTKATLIILYFMHVLHGSRLVWAIVATCLLFLAILIGLTLSDYMSRGWQI
jgi:cytochrome c oxidase subunit 4